MLWTIDLSPPLVGELRQFQARLAGIGDWVFPSTRFPNQPMDRWAMVKWLLVTEGDAPKLRGGVWHPYRRRWAMERKHWPIGDVAAVGGWKRIRIMVECYAQSDRDTMRRVVNEPKTPGNGLGTVAARAVVAARRIHQAEDVTAGGGNEPTHAPAGLSHSSWRGAPHGAESSTLVGESSTATT